MGSNETALTNFDRVDRVVESMIETWDRLDVDADVRSLALDTLGAKVHEDS